MIESSTRFYCPACLSPVVEWEPGPGGRPSATCPTCFSLERHRFLALTLEGLRPILAGAQTILDAAAQPQVQVVLARLAPDVQYVRTDLMDLRYADVCADGTNLPFRDQSIDLVLHFHVLEHIPDDRAAMAEIARVLRPSGLMICQVPRRRGVSTDEDFTLTPEQNTVRFGQKDHVRWYGDDFEDRLVESGLSVVSYTAGEVLSDEQIERFNVPAGQELWFCRRVAHDRPEAAAADAFRVRAELIAVRDQLQILRSRRVVRAGLAAASVARPGFDAMRRLRTRDVDSGTSTR